MHESHLNSGTSIQSFICHYTGIYGQKFYINLGFPKLYHINFLFCDTQCTCQSYLVWYNENFCPSAILAWQWHTVTNSTFLSTTCNAMYISATRLVNLVLPEAFIQLFHMKVHTPYMQFRCDIFQIGFCNFSGVLPHSQTTCSKVTSSKVCNLKDCKPDVQSQQSMWFNVLIGNNRKFE